MGKTGVICSTDNTCRHKQRHGILKRGLERGPRERLGRFGVMTTSGKGTNQSPKECPTY